MNASLFCRILSIAAFGLGTGCARLPVKSGVEHVVIVWLKRPGNAADRQKILDATADLATIPGIGEIKAGTCLTSDRKIVDSSYDVALTMSFNTVQAMEDYVAHPRHQAAVRDVLQPLVSRIVVYDFQTPP